MTLKFGSNQLLGFLPYQERIWKLTGFVVEESMPSEALCLIAQVSLERSLRPSAPRKLCALICSPFCACALSVRLWVCEGRAQGLIHTLAPREPGITSYMKTTETQVFLPNGLQPGSAPISSVLLWFRTNFELINVIELLSFTQNSFGACHWSSSLLTPLHQSSRPVGVSLHPRSGTQTHYGRWNLHQKGTGMCCGEQCCHL